MKSQQDVVSTVSTKQDTRGNLQQAQQQLPQGDLPPFGFAYVWVYKSACADPVRVVSPAGQSVWSAAFSAGVDFPEKCVFLLAGRDVGSSYVLHTGDIVFCRVLPKAVVATLVLSACAVVAGIVAGVAVKKYAEDKISSALKDATAVSASSDSTTSEEYPWLKGAANQVATGRTFPFIIGKTYFAPYKLCAAHMTFTDKTGKDIAGDEFTLANANQFYNTVLEVGFNNVIIKELRLKSVVLADFSDTTTPQGIGDDVASAKYVEVDALFVMWYVSKTGGGKNYYSKVIAMPEGATLESYDTVDVSSTCTIINYVYTLDGTEYSASTQVAGVISKMYQTVSLAATSLAWKTNCLYYDSENCLEIRQDGDFADLTQFNTKKIWTDVGTEIPHDYDDDTEEADEDTTWGEGITCEIPDGSAACEVWLELPTCYYFDDSSDKQEASVSLEAQWTNDGGETWNDFDYDTYGYLTTQEVESDTTTSSTSSGTMSTSVTISMGSGTDNDSYITSELQEALEELHPTWTITIETYSETSNTSGGNTNKSYTATYTVVFSYSYTTESTTTETTTEGTNTITAGTTGVQRFKFYQEFTYDQSFDQSIIVRVRRTSQKYENDASSVYFLGVNTIHFDSELVQSDGASGDDALINYVCRPLQLRLANKCTRLGIALKATDNTSGSLDYFNVIAQGVARTWDGSAWSSDKSETSNLAAWVLEILTTSHHLPSQYSDDELDLDSFGAWYEWCEQEGFCADGVISEDDKKGDILDTLLSNGFASLYVDEFTGLLAVAYDGLEMDDDGEYISKEAIAVLNSDNIISMESTREYTRKTDGIRVSYVDAGSDYATNTFILMLDGEDYDPETDVLEDLSLSYVTNYEHAFKIAWRQLAEANAAPRSVSVQVSAEGAYYPLYSVVYLQHKALALGLGYSKVKSLTWSSAGNLTRIYLTSPVTVPTAGSSTKYGVLINCQSSSYRGVLALQVYTYATSTSLLYVTGTTIAQTADLIPQEGDALSIGELTTDSDGNTSFDLVSAAMRVVNIEPNGAGYTLTLKDYNEDIYNYGTMPAYYTNASATSSGSSVSGGSGTYSSSSTVTSALQALADSLTESSSETSAAASEVVADEVAGLVSRGTHYEQISCVSEDMEEQLYADNIEALRKSIDDVYCSAMIAAELAHEDADALKTGTDTFEKLICSGQVKFTGLPTKDPGVAGRLWNDGGILRIST